MTMGLNTLSAHDVIHEASQALLEDIFRFYGEEPQWKKLAQGIIERRDTQPFLSTQDFATWIAKFLKPWPRKIHRATLAFQALRMYVNEESEELQKFLNHLPEWLKIVPGIALISFHSLEDRLIKRAFLHLEDVHKHIEKSKQDECKQNPRSRSAKFRWVIKKGHSL
jgi:16S rRNA (cytosine1402-N4)-methyltransferase